jgi:hypothetical protein
MILLGSGGCSSSLCNAKVHNLGMSKPIQNTADAHHYIPKFYTKRWTTNGLLTIYERTENGLRIREGSPKSTGYLSKLYSMNRVPPEEQADIEKEFFAPADTLAEKAMHALTNGRAIYKDSFREAWAKYVVGLLIRCPEDLALMRENWLNYVVDVPPHWELAYAETRQPGEPATLADKIKLMTPGDEERSMFRAYLDLFNHQNVLNFVKKMRWCVRDVSGASLKLLTSDRPVIRTNGLKQAGGHIALAIGPTKLFLAARDILSMHELQKMTPNAVVRNYNKQVVEGSGGFVYAADRSQTSFVERWIGTNPQRRIAHSFFDHKRVIRIIDEDMRAAAVGSSLKNH